MATAKPDLLPGELLGGEGGYTVWRKRTSALALLRAGGLPLVLAHGVKVDRHVETGKKGQTLTWADVAVDKSTLAFAIRRALEQQIKPAGADLGD